MRLPDKTEIENWRCEAVIIKLMHDYKWPRALAECWFTDFLRWVYTSRRLSTSHGDFVMDGLSYLDEVWHCYILHTYEYIKMSNQLFDTDYIHHSPENPFNRKRIDAHKYKCQLLALLEDWGEGYINRVFAYGSDVSDLVDGQIFAQ